MVGLSGLSDRSFGGDGRQATLAESFLADLEDLSDNEVEENENETMEGLEGELDGLDADNSLNYENLEAVATLVTTERYNRIVKVTPRPCPLCGCLRRYKTRRRNPPNLRRVGRSLSRVLP
jgi:hypothetical protein